MTISKMRIKQKLSNQVFIQFCFKIIVGKEDEAKKTLTRLRGSENNDIIETGSKFLESNNFRKLCMCMPV